MRLIQLVYCNFIFIVKVIANNKVYKILNSKRNITSILENIKRFMERCAIKCLNHEFLTYMMSIWIFLMEETNLVFVNSNQRGVSVHCYMCYLCVSMFY